ncbi:hypothetical protein [Alienimonas californiensis]|uniref:Uncharacterized protein n=1 Tax=Alienimonas californiensis TaxID=2527989 RepID=A0A517PCZ0_9PLAN|nr:hypothetical protein [Alienimonas californiensis]QDT17245.1 hypothetical protein CA12_33590 [Alienimonas californiensis]
MPEPVDVPVFGTERAVRRWAAARRSEAVRFVAGLGEGAEPAVCVAVERFPEEWSAAAVRGLLDRFPLSAWVVACGAWANGGARTGSPWPAALRCGEAEAARRVLVAVRGEPTPGPLADDRPAPCPPPGVGPLAAFSPDAAYREAVQTLLGGSDGPEWELWDLDAWDARRDAALTRSRLRAPHRVRVGVTGFASPSRTHASVLGTTVRKWDPPEVVWDLVSRSPRLRVPGSAGSGS